MCLLTCLFCFPRSLRVNLDMGKIVYSWVIRRDSKIPGTVVRSSTIPEQLGRISYLLTDKTGERLLGPALGPAWQGVGSGKMESDCGAVTATTGCQRVLP